MKIQILQNSEAVFVVKPYWWWPFMLLGIVWIAEIITLVYGQKKKKDIKILPLLLTLGCMVILYFILKPSRERVTGVYAYYVNGVRISAGLVSFGKRIGLAFFGGMVMHVLAMCLAHLFAHGIRIGKWMYSVSIFMMLFGAIMFVMPFVFSKEFADTNIPMIIFIVSSAMLVLGIIGMTVYKKYKKKHNMRGWP